jgi:hypothetical protein
MRALIGSVPSMAKLEQGSTRTAFDVFDEVSMLILRMSLQALPVSLTIAAGQIIARHL